MSAPRLPSFLLPHRSDTAFPRPQRESVVGDILLHWSTRTPDAVALVENGRSWTYRELERAVRQTADWLESAGARPGDRVVLVCENCCAAVAIYLACTRVRAWPVIVNARLSDREVDEICEHSGARRTIFTSESSLRARHHGERLCARFSEPADFGAVMLGAGNGTAEPEPGEQECADDVAALIYTSGTTGRPKGVMLTHRNLLFVARASAQARRLSPSDRVMAILPVSHILGLTGIVLGALVSGAEICLVSRFEPASLMSALQRDRVSVLIGTPSMYAMLAEYAARKRLAPLAASALRLMSAAGAPLDSATKAAAEHALGRTLHNGYGITECSPTITLTSLDAPRNDCSVGQLLPGIMARLVDSLGNDASSGETGALWVRGPGVMKGYYRAPLETAEAVDKDGWFNTGDLARVENGDFFIVGRSKEMIIRFGFNVYPAEIEGVLNAHPAVARAAVVAKARGGVEDITAFLQLRPGCVDTSAEIADYAAARLASYKRPSEFIFVDTMPLSPAGKVLKSKLTELLDRGFQGTLANAAA